jgi:cytochrome c553
VNVPLPWERLLWSGRPGRPLWPPRRRVRYYLTDFRLVRVAGPAAAEIVLPDIADVSCRVSPLDRLFRTWTIEVAGRVGAFGEPPPPLVLHGVRNGPHVAALIELVSGEPRARLDPAGLAALMAWRPPARPRSPREAIAAFILVAIAVFAVAIGLHGTSGAIAFPGDDAIYPGGVKRDRDAIMRDEVMPWARGALGPVVHGVDRVRCETCHGRDAEAHEWRMPGVAALPQPEVTGLGWERYSGGMDAQMRNAIYGYLAESDKQATAAYMREVVMPGMARLLHRPPYDFTRAYDFNRQRAAFGCYHCHKVK